MAKEARIADLVFKHLQGTLSPEEESELQHWIGQSPRNKALFDKYSNPLYFEDAWKKDKALMERVRPRQQPAAAPVRLWQRPWPRYAAAAILVIAIGVYFLRPGKGTRQQGTNIPAAIAKNDVAPGTNKATLTLSDGSKIVLEKNTDGKLADQGNTKVVSQHGELIYNGGPGGPAKEGGMVYNTLSTSRGEQFPLTLSDGTKIWLNAASSIRFPVAFSGKERHVEITGEAYFEVAKSAHHPFSVSLNGMEITVLGTHFNVNGYTDETSIKTTLVEGAVQVNKGVENMVLAPGQQANLAMSGKITLIKEADIEKAISWKDGYFHFENNNLGTVMREIARWYDVAIIYDNENLKQEGHFKGDIERSLTLSAVLRVLEKSQVHFRIEGKKLIVIP